MVRNGQTEAVQKSWSDIDERLQGVRRCAGRDHAGAACDQRDAQQVFIEERSFCIKTVLTEQITVVGRKDNERILCESERVEVVEDFADIFVHQGNHTVVNFHVAAGIAVGADMAVHAVHQIAAFFIERKVGMLLLGQLVLVGAVFMLAGHDRRNGKFSALIHGVPWGRSKIVWMRIEKARPQKERFTVFFILIQHCTAAFRDPGVVVIFFREIPVIFLRRIHCSGRGGKVIAPVFTALFFHPERVMLTDEKFIRVISGKLYMIKTIEWTVEIFPEIQIL